MSTRRRFISLAQYPLPADAGFKEGLFDGEEAIEVCIENGNCFGWRDLYVWNAATKRWVYQRHANRNE